MQQLFELINDAANETAEERYQRLSESAENAGCDPETLFEIEEDISELSGVAREEIDADPAAKAAELIDELAQELGVPASGPAVVGLAGGNETITSLTTKALTAEPQASAILAKFVYDSYRRRGFYRETGIDPEANWARTDDPISVVGQHLQSDAIGDDGL